MDDVDEMVFRPPRAIDIARRALILSGVVCRASIESYGDEEFLDHIDEWKFKVHEELKGLSPAQGKAYWKRIHEEARARGLNVAELEKPAKRTPKRDGRTG